MGSVFDFIKIAEDESNSDEIRIAAINAMVRSLPHCISEEKQSIKYTLRNIAKRSLPSSYYRTYKGQGESTKVRAINALSEIETKR